MKKTGFFRLFIRSLPEIWFCQAVIGAILWFPMTILNTIFLTLSTLGESSATTASIRTLLTPRVLEMLACSFILVLLLLVGEICAPICLCESIQKQEKTGVIPIIKKSVKALPRFFTPSGLLILLYILFVSPLVGMGFYLSMTRTLYIPRFITEVIDKSMTTFVLYRAALFALGFIGVIHMFVFHGILIDRERPWDAMRRSRQYIVKHWKTILIAFIQLTLIIRILFAVQAFVFDDLPQRFLDSMSSEMPRGYIFNIVDAVETDSLTDEDMALLIYRTLCILQTYISQYVFNIFLAVSSCGTFMVMTRLYLRFRREDEGIAYEPEKYDLKPRNARHVILTLLMFIVPILLAGLSVFMAVFFNKIFPQREKTAVIAHRTGGYLASENSLEGLDEAASHGCYGSETDVQRTLDRYYIINHDTDFARLTGEKRKPSEMTLEEIMDLKIRDTTGNGGLLSVPTLEEMLDHSKGKVKLFLELKGETADRDMADDVVKAVKERDMVDDVALISLDYDVIDYAEQMYPEMKTGVLIFGAVGDVTNLNCDMIIMEEEMASVASTVRKIHDAGKRAGVWTVNTERAMRKFLDSEADMVITDDILMANEVQKELDERADYDILKDRSSDLWFY